jgi:hypothetical protein
MAMGMAWAGMDGGRLDSGARRENRAKITISNQVKQARGPVGKINNNNLQYL